MGLVNHTTLWHIPVLLVAGVASGLTGSITGLASLVSYPVLLAIGLPPITANVTNTVSVVFSGLGSISASGPELGGRWVELRWFIMAGLLGGACGAVLLLVTSSASFKDAVPWLIAGASLAVIAVRRVHPTEATGNDPVRASGATMLGVALVAIYGGYFGAAAGVMLIALLAAKLDTSFARVAAIRILVLTTSNFVAAIIFIFASSVRWSACVPLAAGYFLGGRLGPRVIRLLPVALLRFVISILGLGLAVWLGIQAYG